MFRYNDWQLYKDRPSFFIMITTLFFVLLASLLSGISILETILFIIVQLFCVYIPGKALLHLVKIEFDSALPKIITSYVMGYSFSIFMYLLLLSLDFQSFSAFVFSVISLLSLIYLLTKKNVGKIRAQSDDSIFFVLVLSFAWLIGVVVYQYANLKPDSQDGNVFFYQDLVFWLRNSVASTRSLPLPDLSFAGRNVYYHYFSSLEMGWLSFMTGIELFDLCFSYSYLITTFILISGLYVLAKEILGKSILVYWIVVFVLFTSSLETITYMFFSVHLFVYSFGFAEGLALSCFSLTFFIRWYKGDCQNWAEFLTSAFFLLICTGLKSPVAAILLSGYGIGCLMVLVEKKYYFKGIIAGSIFIGVFLFVLLTFVLTPYVIEKGSTAELSTSFTGTLFHSQYFKSFYNSLINVIPFTPLSFIFVFLAYLFSTFFLPILITCFCFKTYTPIKGIDLILFSMVCTGCLLGMLLYQSGMSQSCFCLVAYLYLYFLVFSKLSQVGDPQKIKSTLSIIFIIGFFLFGLQFVGYSARFTKDILTKVPGLNYSKKIVEENGLTINCQEMEGLRWVRDSLPEDVVLITNKVLVKTGGSRSFLVSSISERQVYFEGYDYSNIGLNRIDNQLNLIRRFYSGNLRAKNALKSKGVTHSIVFKSIKPNYMPVGTALFENNEMAVFKIE